MDQVDLCYRPATELARDIAAKRLSPVEAVEAFLARIEGLNPRLGAYCTLTADEARAAARRAEAAVMRDELLGPLHGVPVSIKDLIVTKGIRTTRGSKLFEGAVPEQDAPTVERLKAAGAIILGKTNTPEFGWKGVTDNRVFGATRNPWHPSRTPGGSSGGGSAQVAAGLGPIAIGTDGGGSIRIPASFAGCYGLKPSFGRVPVYPASPNEPIAHTGPLTNTVRDAALVMNVIAGPDDRDRNSLPASAVDYVAACDHGVRGLRVAWSSDLGFGPVDPEVRQVAEAAARRFDELGCDVETVRLDWDIPLEAWNSFFYGGLVAFLVPRLGEARELLDPGLAAIVEQCRDDSMVGYVQAQFARNALWDGVRHFFERYDLLVTPTMPLTAFEIRRNAPGNVPGRLAEGLAWSFLTFPFNVTGQPAASLPCGFSQDGLPIGLQVVGRRHADVTVLRASAAFEAAAPWQSRRPDLGLEPGPVPSRQ
jgi:aspartyl-tRNA(Asn)/glutamyl-tRNA(Gln) amidotransferase subunit A